MNLLITGIAGFIGSRIAREALQKGYKVFGVDDLSQGYKENIPSGVDFISIDLSKKPEYISLPQNIDFILHLAGQSSGEISFDDPIADLEKNTVSTLNLIEYGISRKVQKIIYASSMSVYGDVLDTPATEERLCAPLSCYGTSKLAAENYLRIFQEQLTFTTFRMFSVYGPGQDLNNLRQGMVSIFLQYALSEGHVPVKGSLARFRDYIYIDDVVNIWLEAITNANTNNQVFNLGTGIKTTVEDLLKRIQSHIPDLTWEEISNTPGDQIGVYANIDKLESIFECTIRSDLGSGLKNFIEQIR